MEAPNKIYCETAHLFFSSLWYMTGIYRIYVDVVFNHMTGGWPQGTPGVGGTTFDSDSESYPGVPYSSLDFNDANCHSNHGDIDDYGNADEVSFQISTIDNAC